jgi:hypothetical protein
MGHYGKSGETGEEKLAAHQAEIARETKATRLRRVAHLSPGQETSQGSGSSYCFVTAKNSGSVIS